MFKDILKTCRVSLRQTQSQMADNMCIPRSTYKSWELGKCMPNFEYFDVVHSYLEIKSCNSQLRKVFRETYNAEKGRKVMSK